MPMTITLMSPGKTKEPHADAWLTDYATRISRFTPCELDFFKVKKDENQEIRERVQRLSPKPRIWMLDERGKMLSSEKLASTLQDTIDSGTGSLVLVVGGAYGLDDKTRALADKVLSFSPMVFPHDLARVMTVEQLYRAFTIIKRMPYHHGG